MVITVPSKVPSMYQSFIDKTHDDLIWILDYCLAVHSKVEVLRFTCSSPKCQKYLDISKAEYKKRYLEYYKHTGNYLRYDCKYHNHKSKCAGVISDRKLDSLIYNKQFRLRLQKDPYACNNRSKR